MIQASYHLYFQPQFFAVIFPHVFWIYIYFTVQYCFVCLFFFQDTNQCFLSIIRQRKELINFHALCMYSFLYLCKNIYIGRTSCDDETYSDPLEVWKDVSFIHKYFCLSCWLSAHLLPSIVFIPLTLLIPTYYSFLFVLSCFKPWVLQNEGQNIYVLS